MSFENKTLNDRDKHAFVELPDGEIARRVSDAGGMSISPLVKYVEAAYSVGDTVVTYTYYESSSKVTLYNTITRTYSVAQCTDFVSQEWS